MNTIINERFKRIWKRFDDFTSLGGMYQSMPILWFLSWAIIILTGIAIYHKAFGWPK